MDSSPKIQVNNDKQDDGPTALARNPKSLSSLGHLSLDLILTAPAILFHVYAILLCIHGGDPVD
jgi:hypothetical protein